MKSGFIDSYLDVSPTVRIARRVASHRGDSFGNVTARPVVSQNKPYDSLMWTIPERYASRLRRVFTVAASSLILTVTAHGQALPVPQTVVLKRGQTIVLQVLTALESDHSQVGDDISLRVFLPVVVDGMTVLPQGWPVHGRVIAVIPSGKNCRQGKVVWAINPITTRDGRVVGISMDITKKRASPAEGQGKHIKDAVNAAVVPLVVLTSPYLVLLAAAMMNEGTCHGAIGAQDMLPAGAVLSAQVSSDVLLSPLP